MKGTTIYAKKTGVEIASVTRKRAKGEFVEKYGAVRMRFFQMEGDKNSIRVILNPVEAAKLGRVLKKLISSQKAVKVQIFYHQYEKDGNKVSTTLTAEKWVKGDKSGYALILHQKNGGEVKINVPMDKDTAYYLGLLMEHLAIEQSWFSVSKEEEEEVPEEEEPPQEEEEEILDEF
ncbi:hypothetical protein [Desulfurobacterium sp.]